MGLRWVARSPPRPPGVGTRCPGGLHPPSSFSSIAGGCWGAVGLGTPIPPSVVLAPGWVQGGACALPPCPSHGHGPQDGALRGDKGPIDGARRPLPAGSHIWGLLVNVFPAGPSPGAWSQDAKGPLQPLPAADKPHGQDAPGRGGEWGGFGVCPAVGRDGCTPGLSLLGGGAAPGLRGATCPGQGWGTPSVPPAAP